VRSKAWVCSRSFAGFVGSNSRRGMDACHLCVGFYQVEVPALG